MGLACLGLLGFGLWDEFCVSCYLGLVRFCWSSSCGSCYLGLETKRVDLDFVWSFYLGLESERVVLVGNEWESSGSTMKVRDDNLFFSFLLFSFFTQPTMRASIFKSNLFLLFFLIKIKIEKSGKNMKNKL